MRLGGAYAGACVKGSEGRRRCRPCEGERVCRETAGPVQPTDVGSSKDLASIPVFSLYSVSNPQLGHVPAHTQMHTCIPPTLCWRCLTPAPAGLLAVLRTPCTFGIPKGHSIAPCPLSLQQQRALLLHPCHQSPCHYTTSPVQVGHDAVDPPHTHNLNSLPPSPSAIRHSLPLCHTTHTHPHTHHAPFPPVQVCHNDVSLPLHLCRITSRRQLLVEAEHTRPRLLHSTSHSRRQPRIQRTIYLTYTIPPITHTNNHTPFMGQHCEWVCWKRM